MCQNVALRGMLRIWNSPHSTSLLCTCIGSSGSYRQLVDFSETEQNVSSAGCNQDQRAEKSWKGCRVIQNLSSRLAFYQNSIYKFCLHGKVHQALELVEEMYNQRLVFNAATFNPIIRRFSDQFLLDEAFETFAVMRRMKIQPTTGSYNILINACVKSGNMERAYRVLAELQQDKAKPNIESFNYIIEGFCQQGRFKRGKSVLREVYEAGLKPNKQTYYTLLRACTSHGDFNAAMECIKEMKHEGLETEELMTNLKGSFHVHSGKLDKAMKVVQEIETAGKNTELDLKCRLLRQLARAERLEEAHKVYYEIKASKKIPIQRSAATLLAAYGNAGRLDLMVEIFEESICHGSFSKSSQMCHSDYYVTASCIHIALSFIRHKQLGQAVKFLQHIFESNITNDMVLFDKILLHIASSGTVRSEHSADVNDGLAILKAMRVLHIRPSRLALEALLDCCTSVGDSVHALEIVQEMEKESLPLNIFTKIRLFRIFVTERNETESLRVLHQMSSDELADQDIQLLILRTVRLYGDEHNGSPRVDNRSVKKTLDTLHEQLQRKSAVVK